MMNRGLMKRQMFAKGGPVRMQGGGLAGIQSSLTAADTAMDRAKSMIGNALGGQMAGAPTFGVATLPLTWAAYLLWPLKQIKKALLVCLERLLN